MPGDEQIKLFTFDAELACCTQKSSQLGEAYKSMNSLKVSSSVQSSCMLSSSAIEIMSPLVLVEGDVDVESIRFNIN